MSIVVKSHKNDDSLYSGQYLTNETNEEYQLLGRGVTLGIAALGELIELVGVVLTNVGVFTGSSDLTLAGLITTGVGIGTIFVIESIVMKRGKDAGIPLDVDLIKRVAVRAMGGIALIVGYATIIAGYTEDDQSIMVGGTVTMDVGVGAGLIGLYLLREYL